MYKAVYAPLALVVYSCRHLFPEEAIHNRHRSSHPETFLVKGVLKKCSKFTGEHPCRSAISNLTWVFVSLEILKVQIVDTTNFGKKHWKITVINTKTLIIVIHENVIIFFLLTCYILFKNSFVSFFKDFRQDIQKAFNTK